MMEVKLEFYSAAEIQEFSAFMARIAAQREKAAGERIANYRARYPAIETLAGAVTEQAPKQKAPPAEDAPGLDLKSARARIQAVCGKDKARNDRLVQLLNETYNHPTIGQLTDQQRLELVETLEKEFPHA